MKNHVKKYGFDWPLPEFEDPWLIEAALYEDDELREALKPHSMSKADHFRAMIRVDFSDDQFAFHRWSDFEIDSYCETPSLTIWGASSTGKSGPVGMIMTQELLIAPTETIIVMVTYPMDKHKDRCWGSMKTWLGMLPKHRHVGKFRTHPAMGYFTNPVTAQRSGVLCISNQQGEGWEDLKKKIGTHQRRNFLVVDEPQGCSPSVLMIPANMAASGKYQEVLLGNPSTWNDPLGVHSMPKDGDIARIMKDQPREWETKNSIRGVPGKCIVLDGRECPTNDSPEEAERLHFLMQPHQVEDMKALFGADSAAFWTYVIGRMPPTGGASTAITELDLKLFGAMDKPIWATPPMLYAGIDTDHNGVDGTDLVFVAVGTSLDGRKIASVHETVEIKVEISQGDISGQIAKQALAELSLRGVPLERLSSDASGGHAIMERLESLVQKPGSVYKVFSQAKPHPDPIPKTRDKTEVDLYHDRKTQIFYRAVTLARSRQLANLGQSEGGRAIVEQLTTRRLVEDSGKTAIEEKRDWRKRHKGKSPNKLDALNVCLTMLHERKILRADTIGATVERNASAATSDPDFAQLWGMKPKPKGFIHRHRLTSAVARP